MEATFRRTALAVLVIAVITIVARYCVRIDSTAANSHVYIRSDGRELNSTVPPDRGAEKVAMQCPRALNGHCSIARHLQVTDNVNFNYRPAAGY